MYAFHNFLLVSVIFTEFQFFLFQFNKKKLETPSTPRGGLGPKYHRGNNFYKGPRHIAEKASHHYKNASIPLKMYLESLKIL
jgi:hypothetical protein